MALYSVWDGESWEGVEMFRSQLSNDDLSLWLMEWQVYSSGISPDHEVSFVVNVRTRKSIDRESKL